MHDFEVTTRARRVDEGREGRQRQMEDDMVLEMAGDANEVLRLVLVST